MSTSRKIFFMAPNKSPMIKVIMSAVKKISKEQERPPTKYDGLTYYPYCMWIHTKAETAEFFGGEHLLTKHPELKLYIDMGSSGTSFYLDGKEYQYPVPQFMKILEAINESGLENDVYMLCTSDGGGNVHKTKPDFCKHWTGLFV